MAMPNWEKNEFYNPRRTKLVNIVIILFFAVFLIFSFYWFKREILVCILPITLPLIIWAIYAILQLWKSKQLEISLPKREFTLDGPITGTVFLNLSKDTHARSLKIIFYGEQMGWGGSLVRVYAQEEQLSTGRTFRRGESIPFSIRIPAEVEKYLPKGKFKVSWFSLLFNPPKPPPWWYVEAKLDLPNASDIVHSVRVKITRADQTKQ